MNPPAAIGTKTFATLSKIFPKIKTIAKPKTAASAEIKFQSNAFFFEYPAWIKTAKSPISWVFHVTPPQLS